MKKNFTIFMALMAFPLISARCFAQDPLVPFDAHSTLWGGMFAPQSPEAMAITRSGTITEAVPVDNFSMSYSGNTLSSVNNSSYSFDSAGNITYDPIRGLTFSYNLLGQPYAVSDSSGEADYTYLADGTKVKVYGESNEDGYAYLGSLVFALSEGDWLFDSTPFYGGQIRKAGSTFVADRFAADHLGSVRALVRNGQVQERNDYYPYGMRHANSYLTPSSANRWRFSAKEIQTTAGVNLIDFGARLYDDRICRWTSQDPLAAKYPAFSPYAYCAGDPVNYIDPKGMDRVIKEKKNSKVITATFYVEPSKYHGISTYDAVSKAAYYLNKAKGLKYTDNNETFNVSFDLSVKPSSLPSKSASKEAGANYVKVDDSIIPQKNENGESIVGESNNGGKMVIIHHSEIGNIGILLHEMLHSMGAAIKTDKDQADPHEQSGLMTKSVNKQTMVLTQQTINDIIENGKELSH